MTDTEHTDRPATYCYQHGTEHVAEACPDYIVNPEAPDDAAWAGVVGAFRGFFDAKNTSSAMDRPHAELVQAIALITQRLERMARHSVRELRHDGATWQQIGDLLGTTRQAAQQRYGR